jgi:hypothetical protein
MTPGIFKGVCLVGLLAVGGCALSAEEGDTGSGGEERVGSVEQSTIVACDQNIYTSCSEWSSNGVTLRTYQCKVQEPPSGSNFNTDYCPVEPGFVVVGGGAQLQGAGPQGSGFIGSIGEPFFRTWGVSATRFPSSTDNLPGIIVWAVGMKLSNHTETQLSDIMVQHVGARVQGTRPQATVTVGANRVLVGGGFNTHGRDSEDFVPRVFVVDAYATSMVGGTWRVNAQSPEGDTGGVTAHAWSLPRCPPRWSGACFSTQVLTSDSTTGTNARSAFNVNPNSSRGVVFSGGVSSVWGRYQYSFFPLSVDHVHSGGSTVSTTDYAATVSGFARTYSFLIWRS